MTDIRDEHFISNLDNALLDEQTSDLPEFEVSYASNIIEKLIHLVRFGNLLTLVVGSNGSGKTRLLNKLLSSIDDDCMVSHINAQPLLSIEQLFQQVIESFAEEATFSGIPLTANQYEEWVEQLTVIPGNRLLIIDDAEVLSTSVLHELCQLSAIQQAKETPHLHIILFGNYDLNSILEQSAQGVLDEDSIYVIDIPSLSDIEAEQWLEYLFARSNINYLPQDVLEEMLHKGQGNLSLLAECVEDYSLANVELDDFEDDAEPWKISVVGYWFGALTILIMLVLGLFFFQDEIEALIGSEVKQTTATTQQPPLTDVKEKIVIADAVVEDAPVEATATIANTTIVDDAVIANTTIVDDAVIANTTIIADAVIEDVLAKDFVKEVAVADTSESAVIPVAITNPYKLTTDEQFLMSEPDTSYVVQIMGLSKESSVQAFLAKHSIPNSHYYRSSLNAKPWFTIVLASYRNKEAATNARANLPTEFTKYGPWIKQMKLIKNEISAAKELSK